MIRPIPISYDRDTDVCTLHIANGIPVRTVHVALNDEGVPGGIIIHLDRLNRILEFVVSGAASSFDPRFLFDEPFLSLIKS